MEKPSNLFVKIDEFIFRKIDLLNNEGFFQKLSDLTANLDENQQKIIAQVTAFIFLLSPYVIVGFLWWGNSNLKKSLEIKKQIIEQIALFDGNKNTLNNISSNYLSPSAINGQEDLDNRVRNILSQNSIDQQKVTVSNYGQTSTSSSVAKIEADLNFRGFGTSDFSNFLRSLIEYERFKILKVSLVKNTQNNLLEGTVTLMHMGQNAFIPEP